MPSRQPFCRLQSSCRCNMLSCMYGGIDISSIDCLERLINAVWPPCGLSDVWVWSRAENSNTHRHLCEFTGLDLEMEINEHYNEVLDLIDRLFVYMFNGLKAACGMLCPHASQAWSWHRSNQALQHSMQSLFHATPSGAGHLVTPACFMQASQMTFR